MAKNEDTPARRAIVAEYDKWAAERSDLAKQSTLLFYTHLQKNEAHLLTFPTKGVDQWQIIHGWLLRTGRVKD